MTVNKTEDSDATKNAFEISGEFPTQLPSRQKVLLLYIDNANAYAVMMYVCAGNMIERIQVICNNQQDLQDWVDHLHRQTKRTSTSSLKAQNVPCHTVRNTYTTSQEFAISTISKKILLFIWSKIQ